MIRQYTASVYIFHENKVLLIYHNKLEKWLPCGGHIEENETPPEAAIREAKEETEIDIEFLRQENIEIDCWNAKSIERPYLCLLENIPEHKGTLPHQHIDFVFIAKPKNEISLHKNSVTISSHENRWFTHKEILELPSDKEIFKETQEVLDHLFQLYNRFSFL
jgi:8-oxo-dGTP pyrophosphatase MutT (NUDIX family)